MAHLVKCKYCGQTFDIEKEPYIKINERRYAHKKCAEAHDKSQSQEERDLEALNKYIMELFNMPYVNARVQKQIKDYHEQYQYTYSGMLKTLQYWYEIKGNTTEKAKGGIGIVPYIYQEACNYYYALYLAQLSNKDKDLSIYQQPDVKTITIPSPCAKRKPHKLFFEGEN